MNSSDIKSIFLPIIDNGMGLSRSTWGASMFALGVSNALKGLMIHAETISYPYPDGAMSLATKQFMVTGADTMLIIDTDLQFKPEHVTMLLSHDVPFVSGLYAKKTLGLILVCSPLESNPDPFAGDTVLCEVARTARGFTRIDREVFEKMTPHVSTYVDADDGKEYPEFWKGLPGGHSEDFNFCDKWREIGGKVYVDKRCMALHEGSAVYPIKGTY